ncbi:hypothetical protein BD413DRAFT_178884 [Trametes elegans]|nr:hypothetical protein BD413DRAFT_178884 [Trametes elegans]
MPLAGLFPQNIPEDQPQNPYQHPYEEAALALLVVMGGRARGGDPVRGSVQRRVVSEPTPQRRPQILQKCHGRGHPPEPHSRQTGDGRCRVHLLGPHWRGCDVYLPPDYQTRSRSASLGTTRTAFPLWVSERRATQNKPPKKKVYNTKASKRFVHR